MTGRAVVQFVHHFVPVVVDALERVPAARVVAHPRAAHRVQRRVLGEARQVDAAVEQLDDVRICGGNGTLTHTVVVSQSGFTPAYLCIRATDASKT